MPSTKSGKGNTRVPSSAPSFPPSSSQSPSIPRGGGGQAPTVQPSGSKSGKGKSGKGKAVKCRSGKSGKGSKSSTSPTGKSSKGPTTPRFLR